MPCCVHGRDGWLSPEPTKPPGGLCPVAAALPTAAVSFAAAVALAATSALGSSIDPPFTVASAASSTIAIALAVSLEAALPHLPIALLLGLVNAHGKQGVHVTS